jgi:uncharacterized membrane protein YqaE (UPF0057 family)
MKVIQVILAFLLPPLAVALRERLGVQFWINLVLTLIGWLPGMIHALYIVLRSEPDREAATGYDAATPQAA